MTDGQRTKLERHQEHVGAGPRLCQPRCNGEPRHAARASEAKDRHPRYVGSKAELARDTRLRQRLARDVQEELLGTLQKGLRPLRPAAPLQIPLHRLDAVTMADAGVGKQARKRFELRIALGHHGPCGFEDFALMKQMRWNRSRQ